ncbi:hypothetical protein [Nocardiopsis dassonvillei]|uniref:hypothetical protein n=1 Tax=Nocardiopsis dassonvillei TaxID=2014 RepID=UPI003637663E
MSIWSTVGPWDHELLALDADQDDATHYRAEGERDIEVGVATAVSFHNNIRLGLYREPAKHPAGQPVDIRVLLTPEAARELIGYLQQAVDAVEQSERHRP